jgi:hypothetical protein
VCHSLDVAAVDFQIIHMQVFQTSMNRNARVRLVIAVVSAIEKQIAL